MQKRQLSILSLMLVWLSLNQAGALASPCWQRNTPSEESKIADVIFAGKVAVANQQVWWGNRIRLTQQPPFIHLPDDRDRYSSTFDVIKVWKGDITARASVMHTIADPVVGYSFRQGEEYIVYAREVNGVLFTIGCYRNNLLSLAGEDLLAFGIGKTPIPNPFSRRDLIQRLTGLFLFLALIGWAFWAMWRRYGVHKS